MPIVTHHDSLTNLNKCYLVTFDATGNECVDDQEGLISQHILEILSKEPITDVFLMSHGWLNEVAEAQEYYDKWIKAVVEYAEIKHIRQTQPDFNPLLIGLHWPSKPFDEAELSHNISFDTTAVAPIQQLIDQYAERLADTPETREALKSIFEAAVTIGDSMFSGLPSKIYGAYKLLKQGIGLVNAYRQSYDIENTELPFDPEGSPLSFDSEGHLLPFSSPSTEIGKHKNAIDEREQNNNKNTKLAIEKYGIEDTHRIKDSVLLPVRLLSFWAMKQRARQIGEKGGFNLLKKLQHNTPATVRIHLIGHGFGCILVSAAIAGTKSGDNTLVRPVNSVTLLQGTLSLWSFCADLPMARGQAGHFHSIIADHKVVGPIITTQSQYDTAAGTLYPQAAGVHSPINFGSELPQYGALGTYGAQGEGLEVKNITMLPLKDSYSFQPGQLYNLESSQFICQSANPLIGAHCDIIKPEIVHALWSTALCSPRISDFKPAKFTRKPPTSFTVGEVKQNDALIHTLEHFIQSSNQQIEQLQTKLSLAQQLLKTLKGIGIV